ncbi:MAG: HEPN domain-containing protein [Gammaproteobacteria bacterium]|nr:HEPN domain-containing protein [Gammaproteobacteria bacterium]
MSDPKQARHLLQVAEEDLGALQAQKDSTVFVDRVFGFTVQQAAEKILKACICLSGSTYPHPHDLSILFDALGEGEADLMESHAGLVQYTAFAGALRYQPADPKMKPLDRENAIALVEALLERARQRLAEKL